MIGDRHGCGRSWQRTPIKAPRHRAPTASKRASRARVPLSARSDSAAACARVRSRSTRRLGRLRAGDAPNRCVRYASASGASSPRLTPSPTLAARSESTRSMRSRWALVLASVPKSPPNARNRPLSAWRRDCDEAGEPPIDAGDSPPRPDRHVTLCKQEVAGSIPAGSILDLPAAKGGFLALRGAPCHAGARGAAKADPDGAVAGDNGWSSRGCWQAGRRRPRSARCPGPARAGVPVSRSSASHLTDRGM